MEMWLHVNGHDYPINYGQTITDNMGEELDSMNVSISHVQDIEMKPFDDAYIHNLGPNAYTGRQYGKLHQLADGEFYRHFLIYNFDRREVNNVSETYNFSITLVSETKYLEKIPMPNRTITIPFNEFGKSVAEMANIFVDRYSPKIKVTSVNNNFWYYRQRFVVSSSSMNFTEAERAELAKRKLLIVDEVFSDVQAPETSFNNPTLREALTKIFSVKNCIPVVYDGIIFARDVSHRGNSISSIKGKIWDTATMSGDQYCDRLRKNYANGLTDKNGCVFHEYVGFRNMDVASMRFSDLKIEVKNPIYKVNKLMLCYYSRDKGGRVVKLDLTSFVLPATTRALLSNNYEEYDKNPPRTINGYLINGEYVLGICDYKFMTVQYGIGDTSITGFGEMVRYTTDGIEWKQRTVLENIINSAIKDSIGIKEFEDAISNEQSDVVPTMHENKVYRVSDIMAETPANSGDLWANIANMASELFNQASSVNGDGSTGIVSTDSLRMKSVFFEIEYQGMVSSAVMVSKDMHDGDIYGIDNQQESMAIMEQDGITSKYKVNRLGNKTSVVTARVDDFSDLVEIGDYDSSHGVCFKRTVSVEKDFLSVNYVFAKNYVLMNYFTGVFSKYRSSAYASFSQSVERNENTDLHLFLTTEKLLLRSSRIGLGFSYSFQLKDIISIFSEHDDINHSMAYFDVEAPIPGTPVYDGGSSQTKKQYYSVDRAYYMSGDSMCCTFGMPDSETAGTYIRQPFPKITDDMATILSATSAYNANGMDAYSAYAFNDSALNDITGSAQGFLSLPKSRNNGSLDNIEFGLCFSENGIQDTLYGAESAHTEGAVKDIYNADLFMLPRLSDNISDVINGSYPNNVVDVSGSFKILEPYKDAKEVINETFQIEPICGEGVRVSPWLLKLSNIFNNSIERLPVQKNIEVDKDAFFVSAEQLKFFCYYRDVSSSSSYFERNFQAYFVHSLGLYVPKGDYSLSILSALINKELNIVLTYRSEVNNNAPYTQFRGGTLEVKIIKITGVSANGISVDMSMKFTFDSPYPSGVESALTGCTKIETEVFSVTWWDSDEIKRRAGDGTVNSDGFYPSQMTSVIYSFRFQERPWNVFEYLYTNRSNLNDYYEGNFISPIDGDRNVFFESVSARRCFCFNFDSFPHNAAVTMTYSDNSHMVVSAEDYNLKSYVMAFVRYSHMGEYDYDRWAYMPLTNSDSYLPTVSHEINGYKNSATGPNKSLINRIGIDKFGNITKGPNLVWYLRNEFIPETFDPQRTYGSHSELVSNGFMRAQQVLIGDDDSRVDDEEIYVKLRTLGPLNKYYSAYLFYIDSDGRYKFVFACDGYTENQIFESKVFASLIPDRSRTVYANSDMEPRYQTNNHVDGNGDINSSYSNDCSAKQL